MLVLSRGKQESIMIDGGKVKVTVLAIRGGRVRIGIEAGSEITVRRKEVIENESKRDIAPNPDSGDGKGESERPGSDPV